MECIYWYNYTCSYKPYLNNIYIHIYAECHWLHWRREWLRLYTKFMWYSMERKRVIYCVCIISNYIEHTTGYHILQWACKYKCIMLGMHVNFWCLFCGLVGLYICLVIIHYPLPHSVWQPFMSAIIIKPIKSKN